MQRNLPQILTSPEFHAHFRQDINLNQISHKSIRQKQQRFTGAMVSLLIDSLSCWKDSNPYYRTIALPSVKTAALVGKNRTKEFLYVLEESGWRVDHSYSTGSTDIKNFCKQAEIPSAVYEKVWEFLVRRSEETDGEQEDQKILTSWGGKAIAGRRKDGSARYHSFQLPDAVRVKHGRLREYVRKLEREDVSAYDRLNARMKMECAREHNGWMQQRYVEALSGRVYGQGASSLAITANELVNEMLAGCWKLDVQACAHTLLPQVCRQICRDEGLKFDGLENYAINRKELRQEWAEVVGCSVGEVKQAVSALIHGCSVASKQWWRGDGRLMESSLRAILGAEAAVEKFKSIGEVKAMLVDIRSLMKLLGDGRKANGGWQWLDGSKRSQVLAGIYQRAESEVLAVMLENLGRQVVISKHDGLVVLERVEESVIGRIQEEVHRRLGFRILLDQEEVGSG